MTIKKLPTTQISEYLIEVAETYAKPEYKQLLTSIKEYYQKYGVLSGKQCKIVLNTLQFQVMQPVENKDLRPLDT